MTTTVLEIAVEGRVSSLSDAARTTLLERRPSDEARLRETVADLILRVRREGDRALEEMARELDGVELAALEVPRPRWRDALDRLDPSVLRALERAARNIGDFHRAQLPSPVQWSTEEGVQLGRRSVPLPSVGVYAPGGRAAYPSSVLMGVVPARAAGVPQVVVCSPPSQNGAPPDLVMAACEIADASSLFALGGAGAVAAMAFGTASVPRVEAIVGPGNQWVTEAKRQVAGEIRIDSPAGPSEVLVVAGPSADPRRVALELLAQAEHDPEAAVAAVTWDEGLLSRIRKCLASELSLAPRRAVMVRALAARGGLLLADDREEALDFAEAYAAEHLSLFTDDPERDMEGQTTAGTIFLGEASSVAFGDYLTGANHVLPTSGRSRAFSSLSVLDFLRFYTWQQVTPSGALGLAGDVGLLAEAEGLPGHAAAARSAAVPRTGSGGRPGSENLGSGGGFDADGTRVTGNEDAR